MIGISLIVHNHVSSTIKTLDTLLKSDINKFDYKLVIVDNGSTDGTADFLFTLIKRIPLTVVLRQTNHGIIKSRNLTYKLLMDENVEFILELHNDMLFPSTWFENMLNIMKAYPDAGVVCPTIIGPKIVTMDTPVDVLESKISRTDVIHECTRESGLKFYLTHPWLLRTEVIREIGMYDENLGMHRCDDDDFAYRMTEAGFKILGTGNSVVFHHGGLIRTGLLPMNKNHEYLVKKHGEGVVRFNKERKHDLHIGH